MLDTYGKRRFLVIKHFDTILNISPLNNAMSTGLSKLIDDARQHISQLNSLNVASEPRITLRILERALPSELRQKWEESLTLDTLPELAEFYTFIENASFRAASLEQETARDKSGSTSKRRSEREIFTNKARRGEGGVRSLVTATSNTCPQCGDEHTIYRCPVFEKMSVPQRWEVVKTKKLCRNCLAAHFGSCGPNRCKVCGRYHHTLLHSGRADLTSSHSAAPSKPKCEPKGRPAA